MVECQRHSNNLNSYKRTSTVRILLFILSAFIGLEDILCFWRASGVNDMPIVYNDRLK